MYIPGTESLMYQGLRTVTPRTMDTSMFCFHDLGFSEIIFQVVSQFLISEFSNVYKDRCLELRFSCWE